MIAEPIRHFSQRHYAITPYSLLLFSPLIRHFEPLLILLLPFSPITPLRCWPIRRLMPFSPPSCHC
jgi:hypothetical protein